jgi:hypothetical protein
MARLKPRPFKESLSWQSGLCVARANYGDSVFARMTAFGIDDGFVGL